MKNRILSLVLALLLVLSAASFLPAAADDAAPELLTLTVFGPESSNTYVHLEDREKYPIWQVLMDKFAEKGVTVEVEVVARDQYDVAVQTRLASGTQLADMMNVNSINTNDLVRMGQQGILLPVNTLLREDASAFIKENVDFMPKLNTCYDGNMYWFTSIMYGTTDIQESSPMAVVIRQDWLDKLGLALPTTIEEFKNACLAMHDGDVNGNGANDEVLSLKLSSFHTGIAQWFGLGADFIYLDQATDTVLTPWYQPELVDYITFMHDLVENDLIDLTTNSTKASENAVIGQRTYATQTWLEPATNDPDAYYRPFMIENAVEGGNRMIVEPSYLSWTNFAFTGNAEAASRALDVFYSEDYMRLCWLGLEDSTYYVDENGEYVVYDDVSNSYWEDRAADGRILGGWMWGGFAFPQSRTNYYVKDLDASLAKAPDDYKTNYAKEVIGKYDKISTNFESMFYAMPNEEQSEIIAAHQNDIKTYSEEMLSALILGDEDIENLPAIVQQLKDLGLDDYIAVYQQLHDTYLTY